MRRRGLNVSLITLLLTGAASASAAVFSGPTFTVTAVWLGGAGTGALSGSSQLTGSLGQPTGASATSPSYVLNAGFINQYPILQSNQSNASSKTIDPAAADVLDVNTGGINVHIEVEAGTFADVVRLTAQPLNSFGEAHSNIARLKGTQLGIEIISDSASAPLKPLAVTFTYTDADVEGMDKARLRIAYYVPSQDRWVPMDSTVDFANKSVTARPRFLGTFRIVETLPGDGLSDIFVFPNPLRPALGQTRMTLSKLPAGAAVKIYSLTGQLVRELSASNIGLAVWDGKNGSGFDTASGIYFVLLHAEGDDRAIKVAVQR